MIPSRIQPPNKIKPQCPHCDLPMLISLAAGTDYGCIECSRKYRFWKVFMPSAGGRAHRWVLLLVEVPHPAA